MHAFRKPTAARKSACLRLLLLATGLSGPTAAFAYIGPGAGITMVGALWAVIVALVFAVGGLIFWPLRSLLRKKKAKGAASAEAQQSAAASDIDQEADAALTEGSHEKTGA